MLILALDAIFTGMEGQVTAYIDHGGADIFVAQSGVRKRRIAKEQGRSVVIVSHDQRIKDIADRVLWLEDGEFKEMVTMATDPVCGMAVEREKAAATLEWAGTTYYFCSPGCKKSFDKEPEKYAGKAQPQAHGGHH